MAEGTITVKIRMSKELTEQLFTRDQEGNRLRLRWDEPDMDGFHTPTIVVDYEDNLLAARLKPILVAFGLDPAQVAALDGRQALEKIGELLLLP